MLLFSVISEFYDAYTNANTDTGNSLHRLSKRAEKHDTFFIVAAILIPVLVLSSGVFAGLTLGYMSLDETQLNVLATSGTAKQREYAKKIIPVRKNGHLLLVSLLLANMIVNETLPIISDKVLGGGVLAVAVSTVLIVIFSEIIPQSICTRHGLYVGAKCAIPTTILMYSLFIISWPVAKILEYVLGPHHGIIYRRAELKELINMHSTISPHGGDLKHDTVTIIGHTLDLQEKVVKDAMTPIEKIFMLPIDARLDYETLRQVCESGHSRVPVYEEVEVKVGGTGVAKKILGILLVKQCVLLDPKDETPLRSIPLNKVPSVPFDEPLLGILDRFQEGRSHMAIVSLFSKGRAASVREAAKTGLTRRFLNNIGLREEEDPEKAWGELRSGNINGVDANKNGEKEKEKEKSMRFITSLDSKEQAMPADAILAIADADEYLSGIDTHINPLGIITLEDVLEELIGEEILDEFDLTGPQAASSYVPPSAKRAAEEQYRRTHTGLMPPSTSITTPPPAVVKNTTGLTGIQFPKVTSSLNIFNRSRSQPGTPRGDLTPLSSDIPKDKERDGFVSDDGKKTSNTDLAEGFIDGTDATTLRGTLTSDTTTTIGQNGVDGSPRVPILLSTDRDRGRSVSTLGVTDPSFRGASPGVTEAILQTQTRRRAQLQQTANSLIGSSSPGVGGELQLPAQRQIVPKGRFKSSPLMSVVDDKDKESVAEEKDKVPGSDPNLKEPKQGL